MHPEIEIILGNLDSAQRAAQLGGAVNMQRWIANAIRGAQRAAALTHRLLAFSRRQPLDRSIRKCSISTIINNYLSEVGRPSSTNFLDSPPPGLLGESRQS